MNPSSEAMTAAEPISRDRAAKLAGLYERHATEALRLGFLLTGDKGHAEDLVHDAFVKMIGRFRHKDDPQHFRAYLKRTLINLATSRRRRKVLEARFNQTRRAEVSHTTMPDIEEHDALMQALNGLTYQQRAVVVLRIYEDMSEHDVGRLLDISPSATRSTLHRAIAALRGQTEEVPNE